jgi:hypothetical protein
VLDEAAEVCPDKKITDLLLGFQDASLSFRACTRRMSEMGIIYANLNYRPIHFVGVH